MLAAYLGALAVGQLGLYVRWVATPDSLCFYLDPRIGLFVLETMLRGHEPVGPSRLEWAVAVWLAVASALVAATSWGARIYLLAEIILALPSAVFFVVVVLANMSPAHGFSVRELTLPVPVFLLFSVVPAVVAYRTWRSPRVTGITTTMR